MSKEDAKHIIESLKEGVKHYEDDYFGGEDLTFGYDFEKKQYYIKRIDTIVGSYNETDYYDSPLPLLERLVRL